MQQNPDQIEQHDGGITGLGLLLALIGTIVIALGMSSGRTSGVEEVDTVPLHNSTANAASDCPDQVGDYWHFVLAPNNAKFSFVSITLNLDGAGTYFTTGQIIPNGKQSDNVFVRVPPDSTLNSIVLVGSSADIAPVSDDPPKFVLSNLCAGTTTTTTSSTSTTTSTSTTSSTSSTTTTTTSTPSTSTTAPPTSSTSTTTTTSTTSTSSTTTTTTAVPCVWDPELPPGEQPCVPDIELTAVCFEIDTTGATTRYWHRLANLESVDVDVSWIDGSATLRGQASLVVASAEPSITVLIGETVVASTAVPSAEHCQQAVRMSKIVDGPERESGEPAPIYSIQVSRLVASTYVPEGPVYELTAGESIEIPLASTFNPEGVNYRIEEVDAGDAHTNSVTPDSFVLNGHRNETIEVTIANTFAAISLEKTASVTLVQPGDDLDYTLIAHNTGALPLQPVTIYDRLPASVTFDGVYTIVGDAGTCTLDQVTRPQLVRCDLPDIVTPGQSAPAITLTVTVDADLRASETMLNQAMSIGTYAGGLVDEAALAEGTFGQGRRLTEQVSTDLSCDPAPGEVCDLSARIGVTVDVPSATTTTTTIVVEQQPPPTTTTTTTTTTTIATTTTTIGELPRAGSGGGQVLILIGTILLLIGGVLLIGSNRPFAFD